MGWRFRTVGFASLEGIRGAVTNEGFFGEWSGGALNGNGQDLNGTARNTVGGLTDGKEGKSHRRTEEQEEGR